MGSGQTKGSYEVKRNTAFQSIIPPDVKSFHMEHLMDSRSFIFSCVCLEKKDRLLFVLTDLVSEVWKHSMSISQLVLQGKDSTVPPQKLWPTYYDALMEAFERKTISFAKEDCKISLRMQNEIELLEFKLLLQPQFRVTSISPMILSLLRCYQQSTRRESQREAEKQQNLQAQVTALQQEVQRLKAQLSQNQNAKRVYSSDDEEDYSEPPSIEEYNATDGPVLIPAAEYVSILQEFKHKLDSKKAFRKYSRKLEHIIQNLGCDSLYCIKLPDSPKGDEKDIEIQDWIRKRFDCASPRKQQMSMRTVAHIIRASEYWRKLMYQRGYTAVFLEKEETQKLMEKVEDWDFNIFRLAEITNGRPLYVMVYFFLKKYGLIEEFNIDRRKIHTFLRRLEADYGNNPYHNSMHAADVVQVVNFLLTSIGVMKHLKSEDVLAAILAACVHDFRHPGVNNFYQVRTSSVLAIRYNDKSVLENYHCSSAFELLMDDNCNLFENMSEKQRKEVRERICDMVLATDMGRHGKILSAFQNRLSEGIDFTKKDDVSLVLQMCLKVADVSNPARPLSLYMGWVKTIIDEFFAQGDKERSQSMDVSPFMDRSTTNIARSQMAFIEYIVIPMFKSFTKLFEDFSFVLSHLQQNKEFWSANLNISSREDLQTFMDSHLEELAPGIFAPNIPGANAV